MRKSEFEDMIQYLKNRPECAAKLMSILEMAKGKGQGSQEDTERGAGDQKAAQRDWKSIGEAAKIVGMSYTWMQKRVCKLSDDFIQVVPGKGKFGFNVKIDMNLALNEIQNLKIH